jgi:hypothetical protein
VVGERQLHQDAVDAVVVVEPRHQLEQLALGHVCGQPAVDRLDAGLLGGLVLEPDVDVRGGVVADEDRRETERPERAHVLGHLAADARCERVAVHQCGHGRETLPSAR